MRNAQNQLNMAPIDEAKALASLGNSSELRTQGRGPNPIENPAMKVMVAVMGRKDRDSTLASTSGQ